MRSRPLSSWFAKAIALLAIGALTGCTAGAEDSTWTVPKVGDDVPAFTASSSLPFDAYQVSASKLAALQLAESRLMADCAQAYGVEIRSSGDYLRPTDLSWSMTGIPFGTLTVGQASQYGYHATPDGSWAPIGGFYIFDVSNIHANPPSFATELEIATVAAVAYGPSTDPNSVQSILETLPTDQSGKPVPVGGCSAIVEKKINAPLSPRIFNNLQAELINLSLAHPAVVKAVGRWSACMQGAGYDFSEVQDGSELYGLTVLTPDEVKTAVADATCTKSSRLADIYYYVLGKYQEQAVAKKSDVLQNVLASQKERLKAIGAG